MTWGGTLPSTGVTAFARTACAAARGACSCSGWRGVSLSNSGRERNNWYGRTTTFRGDVGVGRNQWRAVMAKAALNWLASKQRTTWLSA